MKPRIPLYIKIVGWFVVNLALVALAFFGLLRWQLGAGLDSFVAGQAGRRLRAVAEVMSGSLRDRPRTEWDDVVRRFSDAYGVEFSLWRLDGERLAGSPDVLPPEMTNRVRFMRGMGGPNPPGSPGEPPPDRDSRPSRSEPERESDPAPPGEGREERPPGGRDERFDRVSRGSRGFFFGAPPPEPFIVRTESPSGYWMGMRFLLEEHGATRPILVTLIVRAESLGEGGLLFDFTPWLLAGATVLVISALFWVPLVRGITVAVSAMARTTSAISQGRFEARADERRRDELGALAESINRMASRLEGYVAGQRRFLGDVAHELCSPIARMQMALGILEERSREPAVSSRLSDVREELDHMSKMVNELLSFSKASLGARLVELQTVDVHSVSVDVIRKEAGGRADMRLEVPEGLRVVADPELLRRAMGNLVRNAVRHAGPAGPITLKAVREGANVEINVSDCGPGVPPEALQKIFDPFYRLDESRARETGGTGLGLAIVKACIEACGGSVRACNRMPSGLEVTLRLSAAPAG